MEAAVNYRYKDRLFRFIFGQSRENALSLYNAVNDSHYTNPEELEFNTMEDFIFMGMKNDFSFLLSMEMHLYEHQSSYNPNMPLRGLGYLARAFEAYVRRNRRNIYGRRQIKLPTPHYIVFYNGTEERPDREELRLSDAFEKPGGCLELVVSAYNINAGHNQALLRRCRPLGDYAALVAMVRENQNAGMERDAAVYTAVDDCIRRNILAELLTKHKAEVVGMLFTEYDEEETLRMIREEEREEGREEGRMESVLSAVKSLMKNLSLPMEQCMDAMDIPPEERPRYIKLLRSE